MFDFIRHKVVVSTFQSDFDALRTAPMHVQIDVGTKIWIDLCAIGELSHRELANAVPKLREEYKRARNDALQSGATSALDPDWAHAAMMESVILAMGDEQLSRKIADDIMGWLALIGVITRTQ